MQALPVFPVRRDDPFYVSSPPILVRQEAVRPPPGFEGPRKLTSVEREMFFIVKRQALFINSL